MAGLRELCSSLGLTDVATYLQSGNVVFSAPGPVAADDLARAIAERFGVSATVVLRTGDDLGRIVAGNPFPRAGGTTLHVGFMAGAPDAGTVARLDPGSYAPEFVAVRGRELYFHLPGGMGTAKLPAYVGRHLGVPTTVRNWRTVTALAHLAGGSGGATGGSAGSPGRRR